MEENDINNNELNDLEENNELEENIEINNNFYQDFQNDAEYYYENKKLKEIERRKNDIRQFYYSILELFTKKQYKKIIELFSMKEEEEENTKEEDEYQNINYKKEWIFPFLHINTIERVIQNKINKKNKSLNIMSLKKYIDKENNILNTWLLLLEELIKEHKRKKEDIQCFLEFIIEFLLTKCINLAKYCISHENITEAIYFLSLGIYLINHAHNFFKSPQTYCLSGELLLYLTSILIADNKYNSAKNIINFSVKLLYMSLETIFFFNSNHLSYVIFDILSQEKQNIEYIIKIIFYISILFYHLGVCYENQAIHYLAFYAYKQSKYFLSMIKELDEDIYTFYDFILDVENRQLMRNRLILFFRKNFKSEKLIEEEVKPKIKIYNAFAMKKHNKEKKFTQLENYISNMDLIDVDNEDPHLFDKVDKRFKSNVNIATKQIHLLDYLMSDDFKKIINIMKKIRINKLDYETIHLIQRQIINIKNNEREKLSKKYKNKIKNKTPDIKNLNSKTVNTMPNSKTISSGKKTRVSSGYKNSLTILSDINESESLFVLRSRPSTAQNDRLKIHKNPKSNFFPSNHISKRSLTINNINSILSADSSPQKRNSIIISNKIAKNTNKYIIPKYSYDKYLFNKSFMRKKGNLEKQYSNEIEFQKKLLKCKEKEKNKPDVFSLKKVQTDCEKFFITTFDKEMMKIREKKFIFGTDYIQNMVRRKIKKANMNRTIAEFRKTRRFNQLFINKENKEEDIDEHNYKFINSLMRDIENINQKEKILQSNFRKKKNLKIQIF